MSDLLKEAFAAELEKVTLTVPSTADVVRQARRVRRRRSFAWMVAGVALAAGIAAGSIGLASTQAEGPTVTNPAAPPPRPGTSVVATGTLEGRAWTFLVRSDGRETCMTLEIGDGPKPWSCGGGDPPVSAVDTGSGVGPVNVASGGLDTRVRYIGGAVSGQVDRVVVKPGNHADITLLPVDVGRENRWIAAVFVSDGPYTVEAYDPQGALVYNRPGGR